MAAAATQLPSPERDGLTPGPEQPAPAACNTRLGQTPRPRRPRGGAEGRRGRRSRGCLGGRRGPPRCCGCAGLEELGDCAVGHSPQSGCAAAGLRRGASAGRRPGREPSGDAARLALSRRNAQRRRHDEEGEGRAGRAAVAPCAGGRGGGGAREEAAGSGRPPAPCWGGRGASLPRGGGGAEGARGVSAPSWGGRAHSLPSARRCEGASGGGRESPEETAGRAEGPSLGCPGPGASAKRAAVPIAFFCGKSPFKTIPACCWAMAFSPAHCHVPLWWFWGRRNHIAELIWVLKKKKEREIKITRREAGGVCERPSVCSCKSLPAPGEATSLKQLWLLRWSSSETRLGLAPRGRVSLLHVRKP
ncbi:uncharacterized protein WM294_016761 [Sarcoramphus papa]